MSSFIFEMLYCRSFILDNHSSISYLEKNPLSRLDGCIKGLSSPLRSLWRSLSQGNVLTGASSSSQLHPLSFLAPSNPPSLDKFSHASDNDSEETVSEGGSEISQIEHLLTNFNQSFQKKRLRFRKESTC